MSDWAGANARRSANITELLKNISNIQGRSLDRRAAVHGGIYGDLLAAVNQFGERRFESKEAGKERDFLTGEREAGQTYETGEREAKEAYEMGRPAGQEEAQLRMYLDNPELFDALRTLERIRNPVEASSVEENRQLMYGDPHAYLLDKWLDYSTILSQDPEWTGRPTVGQLEQWKTHVVATFPGDMKPEQRKEIEGAIDGFMQLISGAKAAEALPPTVRRPVLPPPPPGAGAWIMSPIEEQERGRLKETIPENVQAITDALMEMIPRKFPMNPDRQYVRAIQRDLSDDNQLRPANYEKLIELLRKYPVDVQLEYPKAR